ncbi:hypothetical protein [Chitinophaga sp. RAB17]|uniref:hypothetical protein n=1 Tax=Chitinophaga sp. RAB17 TaxID=3233049 RepID=UPI003F8DE808
MIRIYIIASWLNVLLWSLIGLFTIGSIVLSSNVLVINLIVGTIFLLIAALFFFKAFFLVKGVRNGEISSKGGASFSKYLMTDLILTAGIVLFSSIVFSAVLHRIFLEGNPIFG